MIDLQITAAVFLTALNSLLLQNTVCSGSPHSGENCYVIAVVMTSQ